MRRAEGERGSFEASGCSDEERIESRRGMKCLFLATRTNLAFLSGKGIGAGKLPQQVDGEIFLLKERKVLVLAIVQISWLSRKV